LVTIARFFWPAQAYLARCRLEACGIEVWLPDEHMTRLYWHCCIAFGGIRLQVNPEDIEAARAVLDEAPLPAEEPILTDHERTAERAFWAAFFGVFQPLFSLWALWLLVPVLLRRPSMSATGRRNVLLAAVLVAVPFVAGLLVALSRLR
jgi:hypothetical protein